MSELIFPNIHLLKKEIACPCCGDLPPEIYNHPYYREFYLMFENLREAWGRPIKISSGGGWRCPRYQYSLILAHKTDAACSPHFFFALDCDFSAKDECINFVTLVKHHYPDLRIGYRGYLSRGQTFVHVDCCYLVSPRPSETWIEAYEW